MLLFLAADFCAAQGDAGDGGRFKVVWRDGSVSHADGIPGWRARAGEKTPLLDVSFRRPAIDKRRLFDPRSPAMMLWDSSLKSRLAGPFVELANGDILPGRIVDNEVSEHCGYAPIGAAVLISDPISSMGKWRRNIVRVRTESIVRIVGPAARSGTSPLQPGQVVLGDGSRLDAKAVTWRPDGLRVLTGSRVTALSWGRIAEFRSPKTDRQVELLRDTQICAPAESDFLCRMTAVNGAVLTYHSRRLRSSGQPGRCLQVVQPSWAMDGICISPDRVVSESYRRTDEIPLTSMTANVLSQKSMTGFNWPWRLHAGFRGQPLSVGKLQSDIGVAMHSHSEIAFDLPKGSTAFSSWVGIDRAVKRGGCVRCRIHLNDISSKPVWTSGIILGRQEPLRVDIPDLKGAGRLVLVVEFAHRDRPPGADPLDIRDEVSWLRPMVTIDPAEADAAQLDLFDKFPELIGWTISPEMRKRITVRPFYDPRQSKWFNAMVLDGGEKNAGDVAPLVLTREMTVDLSNAWLVLATGRDDRGQAGYRGTVSIGRTQIAGTEGYGSCTTGYAPGDMDTVAHGLGRFLGQKVTVSVSLHPDRSRGGRLCGIIWGRLTPDPIVAGFPADPKAAEPDVPLASLKPIEVESLSAKPGGSNVDLRFCRMKSGLAMPPGVWSVTYKPDKRWRRFVACVGPAGFSNGSMGPFRVIVDGRILWASKRFGRLTRAQYVDIPLPPGGRRLTLRVSNETRNKAVWANAGFKLKGE